jgi:ABC-type uncharacterized transport system substrate-binding protein
MSKKVGFLVATDGKIWKKYTDAFEKQLENCDWKITNKPSGDRDVFIDYQSANGDSKNFSTIAKQFVKDKVDIIVTSGTAPAIACKEATTASGKPTIPVVFASVGDPEGSKLTPAVHMTGGWNQQSSSEMVEERIDHLLAVWDKKSPKSPVSQLCVVYNDGCGPSVTEAALALSLAKDAGITTVQSALVRSQADIQNLANNSSDAFYICSDPVITKFADDLPSKKFTGHAFAEYCDDHGGSCSVGPNLKDMFGTAATYVSLILEAKDPINFAGKLPVFTGGVEHRPKKPKQASGKAKQKSGSRKSKRGANR